MKARAKRKVQAPILTPKIANTATGPIEPLVVKTKQNKNERKIFKCSNIKYYEIELLGCVHVKCLCQEAIEENG